MTDIKDMDYEKWEANVEAFKNVAVEETKL